MNLTARKVLSDCRAAHALLEDEDDAQRFRIYWVAAVALLRAVGHVLKKVDAEQSQQIKQGVDSAYAEWKREREKNAIFWEFIEQERNSVLKEYEMGFLGGPSEVAVPSDDEAFPIDESLYNPITDGRYAGEDCRDVLAEGIAWWDTELTAIETATQGRR